MAAPTFLGASSQSNTNGGTVSVSQQNAGGTNLDTTGGGAGGPLAAGDFFVAVGGTFDRTTNSALIDTFQVDGPSMTVTNRINQALASSNRIYISTGFIPAGDNSTGRNIRITGTGNASDAAAGMVFWFRGVDPTTPLDVTIQTATGASTTNPDPPSITPTSADCMILSGYVSNIIDTSPSGAITNYALTARISGNDANDVQIGGAVRALTGGGGVAENPGAFNTYSASNWLAFTVAIRPAGGGADTVTVTAAGTTITGKTVGVLEQIAVGVVSPTLAGKTVNVADLSITAVTPAAISITGKTVGTSDATTVGGAQPSIAGKSVGSADTIPVARVSPTIAGGTVTPADSGTNTIPVTAAGVSIAGKTVGSSETTPSVAATPAIAGKNVALQDQLPVSPAQPSIAMQNVTVGDTGGTETITVTPAAVSSAGKTIGVSDGVPTTAVQPTVAGKLVGGSESTPVARAQPTITGGTVTVADGGQDFITVQPAAVGTAGKLVGLAETTGVTRASPTIAGRTVGARDSAPVSAAQVSATGKNVTVSNFGTESIIVLPANIAISGKSISLLETVPVIRVQVAPFGRNITLYETVNISAGSIGIAGQNVTVFDDTGAAPAPAIFRQLHLGVDLWL